MNPLLILNSPFSILNFQKRGDRVASSGTILLIDSDSNQNISNQRALERKKFAVHTATDYAEARRIIHEAEPDIIVMEAMLPGGDGFTFCKEIRSLTSAYILFLTCKTDSEDTKLGLNSGGDMYITKPFHMPELMARVEAAMCRRRKAFA